MKKEFKELDDTKELAKFLGISYRRLTEVLYAKRTESLYVSFYIPKKNGTMRCIDAPQEPLKGIQRRLANKLLEVQKHSYTKQNFIVQGFTPERSIITNGKEHRNRKYVVNVDLEDFFDSFHFGRVKGYLKKNINFMLSDEVASCIANLACYKGKLPQGSPASPVLTNLICNILDYRLVSVAKKYRMTYTRYADDLTFSTNRKDFLDKEQDFLLEIYAVVEKSGFIVNKEKTRITYNNSRQDVTGLVVNKKIGVKREYYKEVRAMLDHLYSGKEVRCNGEEVSLQQIEGKLAFINQIDWYNNKQFDEKKTVYRGMNSRERQYQQFLFYKTFFRLNKPLIVTEGKTDVVYIRAALQKLYRKYPLLIQKRSDGSFEYNISFLKRSRKMEFFLGIQSDGADTMKNIYNSYSGKNGYSNQFERLSKKGAVPQGPVILLFDNEQVSKRPLFEFLNYSKSKGMLDSNLYFNLCNNLYVVTVPLVKGKKECEIEDLFPDSVLEHTIDGKTFDRKGKDSEKSYSKQIFATYISKNVSGIDFDSFIPLFNALCEVIKDFENK